MHNAPNQTPLEYTNTNTYKARVAY